jgi:hypothetical protein
MASSAMNERNVILRPSPGDPRKIQAVLVDWGLDEATINRMLSEYNVEAALVQGPSANAPDSRRRSNDAIPNSRRGTGRHP